MMEAQGGSIIRGSILFGTRIRTSFPPQGGCIIRGVYYLGRVNHSRGGYVNICNDVRPPTSG